MTVDVKFGKLMQETEDEEVYQFVGWPGIYRDYEKGVDVGFENDGTSKEYSILSGRPSRSFSNSGFYSWVSRIPQAEVILNLCKPQYPYTQDFEYRRVDQTLLDIISLLPETGSPVDIDRARWFKYWAKRSIEEFGEEAYISFS